MWSLLETESDFRVVYGTDGGQRHRVVIDGGNDRHSGDRKGDDKYCEWTNDDGEHTERDGK